MTAVTTSTKKIASIAKFAYSSAATAGATSIIPAWIDWLSPLIANRRLGGTICGISAPTAGCCTPAPADRTASAA